MTTPAPQTPGHWTIDLTPGREKIDIDGFRLEQHVMAMKLMFSAKDRRPILLLDLAPLTVTVNGTRVEMQGEFRDFLIQHGWRPPE